MGPRGGSGTPSSGDPGGVSRGATAQSRRSRRAGIILPSVGPAERLEPPEARALPSGRRKGIQPAVPDWVPKMAEPISVILVAMLAAFLVGMSKGGLPAVGAVAVPLMALVMSPMLAAALLLPIFCATDLVGLWLYRKLYSARNIAILIPTGILGVGIGWAVAAHISDVFVGMLVGLTGIGFCLRIWLASRRGPAQARPADLPGGVFWGALMGFTSFVSHAGAPPFQMYVLPQKLEKLVFAGTATITFAVINAAKIIPYWQLNSFSAVDPKLALLVLPVGIAGTYAGAKLTRIIPDGLFFRLVQITLFVISLKLVGDAIVVFARG